VAQVVSQAARELSLVTADIADPYASTNPNILQMCSLLTAAGREIIREYSWTQSIAEASVTTSAGVETYALPADFLRMLNQTGWDRTTRFPLGGPLSPQEWQYLKSRLAAVTFRVLFRPLQGALHIYAGTSVPAGHSLKYEYMSSYWVGTTATVGTKDAPTLAGDYLFFDTHLMSRALKRAFLRAKGFDTQAVEEDYQKALAAVMRDDTPAPVLSLTGGRRGELPIGEQSIPVTGFGS
jgi:hypothetical protein